MSRITATVTPSYMSEEEARLRSQVSSAVFAVWFLTTASIGAWWAGVGLASLMPEGWVVPILYAGRAVSLYCLLVAGYGLREYTHRKEKLDLFLKQEASASCKGDCRGCGSASPSGKPPNQSAANRAAGCNN